MTNGLRFISARVGHARLRPKRNHFRYRVPYLAVPESACAEAACTVLSIGRANLFAVRLTDYGGEGVHGFAWVRRILAQWNAREADGEIVLITMPRVLGFAFNPVSFWLCHDRAGALRVVVGEVNNTFGERHFYVCRHGDGRAIEPHDTIVAQKVFHVSPFMKVEGHYAFAFSYDARSFGVRIDLHDADGLILVTSMAGRPVPATSWRLMRSLIADPLMMFKALALIHYQALRLWAKGVRHFAKPPPPVVSSSS